MRRTRLLLSLIATLAVLPALGGAGDATARVDGERAFVTVPRVTGLSAEDAFDRLGDAGLRVTTSERVRLGPAVGLPAVLRQHPRPGARVKTGAVVALRFCWQDSGLVMPTFDEVAVPRVAGLPLREALARLEDSPVVWSAMLPPVRATSASSFLDAYRVTGQTPAAGTRFVQTTKRGTRFHWTVLELQVTG